MMTIRNARMTTPRLIVVFLALALVAAACGGDDDSTDPVDPAATVPTDPDPDDPDPTPTDPDDPTTTVADTVPTTTAPVDPCKRADFEVEFVAAPSYVPPAEAAPVSGGTLRVGVEAETDGLNPVANNFPVSAYLMGYTMIEPLAYFDSEGNWFPWLAESFTQMEVEDGDYYPWKMKLREGILFHDGSELDADDIIANFEAQLADPIISLAVKPSYPDAKDKKPIEKIDNYTVQYNLIRPSAHFPVNITSQLGMVVPSEYVQKAAEDATLDQAPIGTGPFKWESRVQDDVTVVVKNEDYWRGADNVHLDSIEFHVITDTAIAAERLAVGDLDVLVTSNPEAILTLREADGIVTNENLISGENDIMMNTRKAPFDNEEVRKALTYATDRKGYFELIAQGTSPLADSMFHPELDWSINKDKDNKNKALVQEGNCPDEAGPIVQKYCAENPDNCTDDNKIKMELQYSGPSVTQSRIADLLINGWEPFFEITEQELLQDQHILEVALGQFDVVTWRQFGAVDPDNEVVWLECATAEGPITINWVRVCNEERDELMFEQRATEDRDRRIEIWREIQEDMNETYSYIFTTHANWTIGHNERVMGICGSNGPTGPGDIELFCNNQGRVFFHGAWLADK